MGNCIDRILIDPTMSMREWLALKDQITAMGFEKNVQAHFHRCRVHMLTFDDPTVAIQIKLIL